MGTPAFAVYSLKKLIENGYDIPLVVTVPDKPKGRGLLTHQSEIKKFAIQNNINVLQPENLNNDNFVNQIKLSNPDLIVVVAFRILPKEVFSIPKSGTFNLHASLLPKYRGAAPINWALINGEKKTGVTTFFLQEKVDTGNIIMQKEISIDDDDNAGTLHDKLAILGSEVVIETIRKIENDELELISQNDAEATKAPKISKEICKINWNNSSHNINNLIRGLSPYPSAYTLFESKNFKITKSKITNIGFDSEPGTFVVNGKKLFVNTNDKLLEIIIIKPEGKRPMSVIDFLNGFKRTNGKFE